MARFVRCRGKTYCVEDTSGCRSCVRSHGEIETCRSLVAQAAQFVLDEDYHDAGEFASYLAEKIQSKDNYARSHDQ